MAPSPPTTRDSLRAARKARGLSQQALADRVGIHQVTLARYEMEQKEPSVRRALAIAKALGTTVERLFDHEVEAVR